MLIRFSVKNFLSFASREDNMSEEFSMIAGRVRGKKEHLYDDGKIKLLKFAAVYGANAAGKSNGFYETGSGQWSAGWTYRKILQSKSGKCYEAKLF